MAILEESLPNGAACPVLKIKDTTDVVVGISGCSGSGKSTLTAILHFIFERAIKNGLSNGNGPPAIVTVLCDSHFIPKPECPRTHFRPVFPGDAYVMSGLPEYIHPGVFECPDTDTPLALDYPRMCDTLETEFGTAAYKEKQQKFQLQQQKKEDDYCQQQILKLKSRIRSGSTIGGNLPAGTLQEALRLIQASASYQLSLNHKIGFQGLIFRADDSPGDGLHPNGAAAAGQNGTNDHAAVNGSNGNAGQENKPPGKQTEGSVAVSCRLALVEGFLLYPSDVNDPSTSWGKALATATDPQVKENLRHAKKLCDCLDLRLYMPLDRATARHRRLNRPTYVDTIALEGGGRQPGQSWKTEGYFNDVAWPNHERFHRHLFTEEIQKTYTDFDPQEGGQAMGCIIRGDRDADLARTVMWAVQQILNHLEEKEQAARSQFLAAKLPSMRPA
ncbi:hypothetical protein MAPG_01738 [Magnaporthiopsis poae ATCC 64411]|uniref:Uncharacterized protein n=1 Tax=Magnaporthiopsis poae (strain ATCC 64411 / 73-15) TaxID=644358 RepID=A0A0C4DPH2_MAGP6|nr:hypothetical protein MAPG_01738 [Magnaporthiopsis poae ATCC 64411]